MFGNGILKGKKTYIMGGLAAIAAIAAYLTGDADLKTTLEAVWQAALGAGLIALRAGVASK